MALSSVTTEEYTSLFRQSQLPEEEMLTKGILTKSLEEVLRMHGVRSATVFRTKVQMLEALKNTKMISLFRSTLDSSEIKGAAVDPAADLKALHWSDGEILEVVTLEPITREE
ncbi:hypothetical protein SELMODRAFT_415573 [Selaginella moellendorffii]|uniref:Uncharacterized protein n=1 Tax=Selaginella moellendorffii TaxID=88036 RepID=D8RWJ7_SELML|nr:hypothetical protein SELMODRAFT_415573 [Selaginella moellendorffii]